MKKILFFTLFISFCFNTKAQIDSINKIKLSSIGLELLFITSAEFSNKTTREQLQKFAPNDKILNQVPATATVSGGYFYRNYFPGIFSAKAFFDLKPYKKFKSQFFIGLGYGNEIVSTLSYYDSFYDTNSVYVDQVTNKRLYLVDEFQNQYQFSIVSKKILMPFGIQVISNKNKRFWFSTGIEICPGISFSNVYNAYSQIINYSLILNETSSYNNYNSYSRDFTNIKIINSEQSKKNIPGIGFTGYLSVPFTINMRVSKKLRFLNHLHLYSSMAPGFFLSANRFSKTRTNFILNLTGGIRYNI